VIGFRFVEDHQAEYRITDLCRVAGVSRSGFYAWRERPLSARAQANAVLLDEIREIHEASRRTYGAPRVKGQLRHRGIRVSRHRVARLMAREGLVGVHGRRKWRKGRHSKMVPAPDLLERDFTAERSDLRWVADITEFACEDGKLFLAAIRDLCDHSIVGWSMGERQTTDLVVAALVMALGRREPTRELVHHADHGSQYTSLEFTNRLADWKLNGSYGSVGDAYDNAAMEAFWATLKKEVRHIWGPVEHFTRSELRTILFDYIEVFYNRSRHQVALDDRTPAETYAADRAA
jgi:transposase InsO family protein